MYRRLGGDEAAAAAERDFAELTEESAAEFERVCSPLHSARPGAAEHSRQELARSIRTVDVNLHYFRHEAPRFDPWSVLPKIACPVLVLAGEDDPICPLPAVEELASNLPGETTRLVRLPQARHAVSGIGRTWPFQPLWISSGTWTRRGPRPGLNSGLCSWGRWWPTASGAVTVLVSLGHLRASEVGYDPGDARAGTTSAGISTVRSQWGGKTRICVGPPIIWASQSPPGDFSMTPMEGHLQVKGRQVGNVLEYGYPPPAEQIRIHPQPGGYPGRLGTCAFFRAARARRRALPPGVRGPRSASH